MGLSNKRIKAGSVLGFVFMPQFRTMMPAFGHLRPILVRTLALMFEQAGLLSPNHPSTQYGTAVQGNVKLREILAEAWVNLRTQNGMGAYQYGLFISIMMMITFMISSIVIVIVMFSSSFVTVAKAQLFDHPSGLSTSVVDLGAYAGPALFDDRTPGVNGTAPDLAIDILNKTLRQALEGNGGLLQEGLASLLAVYSTGVMVIAALLIFWAIVSITIDSARTGYIGGGRHNISWVPLRFVFAMSLLVPWANGFNAGQVAVLQLTEWGSNLASNGWAAYVQSVAHESLVVKLAPNNPEKLAVAAARNFTCAVAANAYLARLFDETVPASLEALPEAVKLIADPTTVVNGPAAGPNGTVVNVTGGSERSSFSWYYGNDISKAFCGGFDIPNPAGADLTVAIAAGGSEGIIAEIKQDMRNAHLQGLVLIESKANEIGCAFGSKTIPDFATTVLPRGGGDLIGCNGAQIAACGGNTKTFDDTGMITNNCLIEMVKIYADQVKVAGSDPVRAKIENFVQDGAAGGFLEEVRFRGWAGMGMWYHQISTLNSGFVSANDGGIKVIEPTYMKVVGGELLTKINNSLSVYDNWWVNLDKTTLPTSIIGDVGDVAKPGLGRGGDSAGSDVSSKDLVGIFTGKGNGGARVNVFLEVLFPSDGFFVGDLSRYGDGTYPLAALSGVAITMWLWIGGALFAISFMVALLSGVEFSTVTSGKLSTFFLGKTAVKYDLGDVVLTILGGPFGILLQSLSGLLIMVTLLLLYVVPMLPWLRVTFGVLSWIMTVFEAVVMVPVVALAHLRTEGEGLMGPMARGAYILWLNLLLRPILMVIGYVAALLVFNAMTQYVNNTFSEAAWGVNETTPGPVGRIMYSIMYVGIIYTMANSAFKAIDLFPNATMKWLGGGSPDRSFYDSKVEALIVVGERSGRRLGTQIGNSAYGGRFGFRRLTNWRKSTGAHRRKMKEGKEFGDTMAGKARKHGL